MAARDVFDEVVRGLRQARSRLIKEVSTIDRAIAALEDLRYHPEKFKAEAERFAEEAAASCCGQHGQRCFAEGVTQVCCVECPSWKMEG